MIAEVNGVRLFYEQYGSGSPLILVHGNGEDHTIFDEAVEMLSCRYTCYAVDSRGHGRSVYRGAFHYRDMAADYLAFMEALDLSDVTPLFSMHISAAAVMRSNTPASGMSLRVYTIVCP